MSRGSIDFGTELGELFQRTPVRPEPADDGSGDQRRSGTTVRAAGRHRSRGRCVLTGRPPKPGANEPARRSDPDAFDLVEGEAVVAAVVELGGTGAGVVGHDG